MSRVLFRLLCKLVQRQTYTCLSTRCGIILCLGGLLLTLISTLQFGEVLIEWSLQKYSLKYDIYHDNVGGRSYQDRLCLPIPIDVVYTWVNGSDEKLIVELRTLKEKLAQENVTDAILNQGKSKNGSTSKYAGRLLKRALSSRARGNTKVDLDIRCTHAECVAGRIVVAVNTFKDQGLTLEHARNLHPSFRVISKVQNSTSQRKDHVVLMYFPNAEGTHNALQEKVKFHGENVVFFQGYFTTDSKIQESVQSKSEIIISGFQKYTDLAELHKVLQQKFGKKLSDISYEPKKHIAIVYFVDLTTAKSALEEFKGNYTVDGSVTLKISPAFLVWTYSWSFQDEPASSSDEEEDHVISANRFADNQELKYSLRSIEKFAPWVRNIYIVTNGQIPSWLKLENPRVKVITHKQLFQNQSHLPTFSSPAIESHLHRIPGLSQKFIYMNDDVMFGDHVWPDDFYTHAKGQKLYLTWNVPNCNEGCPASWIQDKYCDKACNVSECDFDGGDCIGVKKGSRYSYQSWHQQQASFRLDFCSTGCADTWVGDRYCDTACNVYKCGFDAGDCGIANFHQIHQVNVLKDNQEFNLPDGLKVVYFNLSRVFGDGKIVEAKYSENMIIRTAIVAQKPKLLSVILRNNYTRTTLSFSITGTFNETKKVTINFNVTTQTTGSYDPTEKPGSTMSPTTQANVTPTVPMLKKAIDFKSIQILYSKKSINYWTVVNGSIPKPAWIEFNSEEYRVPHITNETVLPDNIHKTLEILDRELKEGDITEKGYKRHKAKVLKDYFSKDGYHGNSARTNQDSLPYKNKEDKKQLKHHDKGEKQRPQPKEYPSQHYNRHLLSIDPLQEHQLTSHYSTVLGEGQRNKLFSSIAGEQPSHDELFLANWIADTKRKQLSYKDDLEKSLHAWQERYGDWDPLKHDTETSFLPWERQRVFETLQTRQKQRHEHDYSTLGQRGRKLLDTFADSLLHVHRLYNRKFGYSGRKVPAHMPHMIDVKVMEELQSTFPEEFDVTSSHKLRSSDDMQFAFSYNYFVIGQTNSLNVTQLFAELDTDHSGVLSDRELRTLATRIYPLPLSLSYLRKLEKSLINCSVELDPVSKQEKNEENLEPTLPLVTESLLSACTEVTKLLNESKGTTKKYKHETVGDEDIWFKMITNNASLVLIQLDNVRARRKKFICLNDNIDHSSIQNASLVRALLVDFYESFFPIPSQFELPANYRNGFLYVEDLNEWKKENKEQKERNILIIGGIVVFLSMLIFWRKIVRFLKWLFRFRRSFIPSVSNSGNTRLHSI